VHSADACKRQLKSSPVVKFNDPNDPESLKLFAELLEKALITVDDMNYLGSLISLDTMVQLVNTLPFHLKRSWVKEFVTIESRSDTVGDFRNLVQFVVNRSKEANSLFGRKILGVKPQPPSQRSVKSYNLKAASYNVEATKMPPSASNVKRESKIACFFCKSKFHLLEECPKFKEASLKERSTFINSNKFCYKCLSCKRRTFYCTKRHTYSVTGCSRTFHHTLLHPVKPSPSKSDSERSNAEPSTPPSNSVNEPINVERFETVTSCSSAQTTGINLCVVPVKVRYKNTIVKTYAFLDQGSTRTFCDKKLVDALKASGSTDEVKVQTLTNVQRYEEINLSLSVSSLEGEKCILCPIFYLTQIFLCLCHVFKRGGWKALLLRINLS